MSSRSETGVLRVSATLPGTRFGLLDASGAEVRSGADDLDVRVRAGVYDLIADRAGMHARQLVRVRSGAPRDERVDLDVPGSPIVAGTVAFYAHAAEALASTGTRSDSDSSSVIIVIGPGLSTRRSRRPAVRLTEVDTGRPVRLSFARHGGIAIGQAAPAAGGYLLTTSWRDAANAVVTIVQSMWLLRGWRTIMALPADAHGAYADRASIHLVLSARRGIRVPTRTSSPSWPWPNFGRDTRI